MKNLVWQYHIEINRSYDGAYRKSMAMASSSLATLYASKVNAEYMLKSNNKYYMKGICGGPAMERFQLFGEDYDEFDYILYLDTDILIPPNAENVFDLYTPCDIAAVNTLHERDLALLERGWLSKEIEDQEAYISCYSYGGFLLMSRNFRQSIRKNVDIRCINVDEGLHWSRDGIRVTWPVYDQSIISYWTYKLNLKLTKVGVTDDNPNGSLRKIRFFNYGGKKNNIMYMSYFARFSNFIQLWSEDLKIKN